MSAVLVVTTLPAVGRFRARVLSTIDTGQAAEAEVVVQSLAELQEVVAGWWWESWDHAGSVDPD